MRQSLLLLWSALPLWLAEAFAPTTTISSRQSTRPALSFVRMSSSSTRSAATSLPLPEGLLKTVSREGTGPPVQLGDIATIKYSCYVANAKTPFAKSAAQKMVVGDGTMIAGWDPAVRSMRVGERSLVKITNPDTLGYGELGVHPVVPPNADLELDLEILDAQAATANIDFDSLAEADATPRTAADIAAAYQARQVAAASQEGPELEGLDLWIEKAKNFYFYGLFEGETGERPPWFLRPSITFPLAFLIVGAAFYVSFVSGAITERGSQTTDELDQIIMSSNNAGAVIMSSVLTAFASAGPADLSF